MSRKMRPASCTVSWMLVLQLVSSVAAANISLPTDPLASLLAWPLPGTVFTWGDTVNYRVDQASCSGATISAYETAGSNLSIGLTTLTPCNGTVDTPLAPLNSGRYNFVIKVVGSSNATSAAKDTSTDSISYAVLNPSVWEAENTDALNGTTLKNQTTLDVSGGMDLAGITNGTSVRYDGWNLYNIDSITVRASSGMATPLQSLGSFEVRVNSPTGRRIARGDIAGTGNWSTYRDYTVGVTDTNQYFILDFGVPTTVSKLLLNSTGSPGDYPRSYIIFVSDDGMDFGSDSVLSGKGDSSLVTITFPAPVTTRFIKIVQAGASEYQWWSIHEMYALDGQGALLDRSGWAASASSTGSQLTESMAFDGNLTSKWGSGETQRSGLVSLHFVFLAKGTALPATELFRINRFTFGGQGIAVNSKPQTGNFTLPYTFNVNTSAVGVFTDPLAVFSNSSAAAPTSVGVANATAGAITMLPNSTANGTMAGAITLLPNSMANGTAGNASVAINCGSNMALTLADGTVFAADIYFVGGMMLPNLLTFTGTADQALYQKERYGAGNFSYQIPLPNGSYVVSIFEAETVFNASLKRVFDVFINGREEISALDVFNATGGNHRALVLTRSTSLTTGLLTVLFSPLVGEAKVSGISVAPYVPGKNVTALPGRLEAENYRAGGQGIGYSDFSKGNDFGNDARLNNCTNGDDVDVGAALDVVPGKGVVPGCMVGMILPNEWLQYDVTFATAGLYSVTFRTASNSTNPKQAHLEVDGADVTGSVVFPAMGSWQIFSDSTVVTKTVISAGPHLVRLVFDSGDVNFNYIDFKLQL